MYNNYFSNRIKISEIKDNISSRIPTGDPRQTFLDPNASRIQRLQGFATRTLPNSQYVATSFGTNDFPTTKGQLVIVTDGYNSVDGSRLNLGDSGYNERFTGDIRLLDGGETRIGQTFPPAGTLGYFAYNSIPDGWLEMVGQSVLFEKSTGFYKVETDGTIVQVSDRADSDYEETIETEFTPLYNVLASWGLAEISPSILGWNVTIPAMQGYYIRCLNPSASGPDAENNLWFTGTVGTNERAKLNARYFTPEDNINASFGDIPVVKHRHYGNVLHRNQEAGDKDWGITNFTFFWTNTRVSSGFTEGEIAQSEDYDFMPHHDGSYNHNNHNYNYDYTAGRPNNIGRKQIVGDVTQYIRRRYYPYQGYNSWKSVSYTNAFHDGWPAHGSRAYYHSNGYTQEDRGEIRHAPYGDEWRGYNFGHEHWYGYYTSEGMKCGRINSFIEHFHNNTWTYWRQSDGFSGFIFHAMFSGLSSVQYSWNCYHYTCYANFWNTHHWRNRDNGEPGNTNLNFAFPYHIKKSPQGTAKESETLNTGNDGEKSSASGNHNHNLYNGQNSVFSRGGYENRPKSVALRLCIKY